MEGVRSVAHYLKGSAMYLGLQRMRELCQGIEMLTVLNGGRDAGRCRSACWKRNSPAYAAKLAGAAASGQKQRSGRPVGMAGKSIRILIADDHPVVRLGVRNLLDADQFTSSVRPTMAGARSNWLANCVPTSSCSIWLCRDCPDWRCCANWRGRSRRPCHTADRENRKTAIAGSASAGGARHSAERFRSQGSGESHSRRCRGPVLDGAKRGREFSGSNQPAE